MKRLLCSIAIALVLFSCNVDERFSEEESLCLECRVFDYCPAPGQFINDGKTAGFLVPILSAEEAAAYAESRLGSGAWVSLGGFGGYIVVGFDRAISNVEGFDFGVVGNSFEHSSEPGIVWVMQDENGDGEPNDVWYELAGSESGKVETLRDYAVTYYRPTVAKSDVRWSDSEGESGKITYLASHHQQDYYYPMWIEGDSYTLRGTRLKERNYDASGSGVKWIQPSYDWGYADNYSSIDGPAVNVTTRDNRFDISNAVDSEGCAVTLTHIDFVKVQTACNTESGYMGESSTEVRGFNDYTIQFDR